MDLPLSVVSKVGEELGGDPELTAAKLLFLQEQVSISSYLKETLKKGLFEASRYKNEDMKIYFFNLNFQL